MKKTVTKTLAIALTLGSLYSPPSKALVAVATGSAAILVAGLVVGSGGSLVIAAADRPFEEFLLASLFGIVMLDGEHGRTLEFTAVNAEAAKKLGITKEERLSYNSELDQVNFLLSDVNEEIQSTTKDINASERAWASVKDLVSPGTFSAMTKIANGMVK